MAEILSIALVGTVFTVGLCAGIVIGMLMVTLSRSGEVEYYHRLLHQKRAHDRQSES